MLSACKKSCLANPVPDDAVGPGFDRNVALCFCTLGDVVEDAGGMGDGRRDVLGPDSREEGGGRCSTAASCAALKLSISSRRFLAKAAISEVIASSVCGSVPSKM